MSPVIEAMLRRQSSQSGDEPSTPLETRRDLPHEDLPPDTWAVEIHGLHKSFGGNDVLCGVDLRIPEGAISVVLGPSGTGKSVLVSHLTGLLAPDRGTITVRGRELASLSAAQLIEMRRRFGILFQDGALFGSMPVYDNVAFPLRQHTDLSEHEIERLVLARLGEVGLAEAADVLPSKLSGGMRKRVGFARALVLEPEIVLFDEPDSGLDPVRTSLLSDLIRDSHARHGGTYLVVTHDISVARKLADFAALLWQGRVIQAGTREAVFASKDPFVRQFLAGDTDGPLGMD
jgi:phospholipid/cholesterol/gamma-HCH transport system ATP-binding protein